MAQQTAVEFLEPLILEKIQLLSLKKRHEIVSIINQAKEMENKRTIEFSEQYNSYLRKCSRGVRGSVVEMDTEQYYKEVFKK